MAAYVFNGAFQPLLDALGNLVALPGSLLLGILVLAGEGADALLQTERKVTQIKFVFLTLLKELS
jgi:hypothetical protein